MNSRVSWSVDGIDPSVRERAEAAARRAGMSLNEWLNSTVGDASPPDYRAATEQRPPMPSRESREVADIHQRLDAITHQIEQIARPVSRGEAVRAEVPRGQPAVARQLNDAISRLDARLSQISRPQAMREAAQPQPMREAPQQPMREPPISERQPPIQERLQQERLQQERQRQSEMVERAAAQVYRASPPLSPASFDFAIAEIAARQNELDDPAPRQMPPRSAPTAPPAPPMSAYAPPPQAAPAGPDFSSLERHLLKITSQIEALQRPDHIEQSIAAFRGELADIRQAITEAMPRRAIESIENEIRSLHRRIDEIRQDGAGGQGQAIAGIERALSEIREALRTLTPAEQLTGYDEAIRNLGAKLDTILRANDDPSTVHQLEGAIAALRAIVSNVASNDALLRLSEDVHSLSAKVDQLSQMSRGDTASDAFAVLEQRIAALASTLESRQPPAGHENTDAIEGAVRALSERIDRLQVGNDSASAFTHLEQRVSYLLERLEATDQRTSNLGRVEEGLHDIMRHLEAQHAHIASLADATRNFNGASPQPMMDSGIVDMVKRELSDIRFSQSETDRRTQDSLETVHNTLGHVVDRLAMIENDLRTVRTAPPAPEPVQARMEMPRAAMPQPVAQPGHDTYRSESNRPDSYKPELPNPALAQEHFAAASRDFHAAQPSVATPPPLLPTPPRAISEILEPHTAPARPAIAPELPPDHPLEPGTRPTGRASSPSERIAASENAISDLPAGKKEPVSTSSFIAAARRAAQAAATQPVNEKAARAASKAAAKAKAKDDKAAKAASIKGGAPAESQPSTITSKIRSLLVGASVVVIVLGAFKMAMNMLDTGSPPTPAPAMESSEPATPPARTPAENSAVPAPMAPSTAPGPSMTSPTPLDRQSNNTSAPNTLDGAQLTIPQAVPPAAMPAPAAAPAAAMPASANDVTGAIPVAVAPPLGGKLGTIQIPPGEKLPDAIGGPVLRAAALKGDPGAAYEVGLRFAEGKGVAANLDEAAKWYSRAAQAGVVPAIFRLGTFYEKGLSVKRDYDVARRYYVQAADRGNAKAMHNLAVLDADGGGKGANYKSASIWFRKAADRGVADSQFNLGILYARGIGVEQNLAESFKWFSLAAAQGDADAGHKRDDIAKRLDPQSLAAAKLAIQTFTAEPQPSDAIGVQVPAGGWDGAAVQPAAAKPAKPPAKRTAALTAAH